MRISAMLCCLLAFCAAMSGDKTKMSDPYSVSLIKFELSMRSGGRKMIHSYAQKGLYRLGDGASVALLKTLEAEALKNPQTVREILPIIRDSFSQPEQIEADTDQNPKVTIFLLNHLHQNIQDDQVRSEIQQTIDFVKQKTTT